MFKDAGFVWFLVRIFFAVLLGTGLVFLISHYHRKGRGRTLYLIRQVVIFFPSFIVSLLGVSLLSQKFHLGEVFQDKFWPLTPEARVQKVADLELFRAVGEAGLIDSFKEMAKREGRDPASLGKELAWKGTKRLDEESITAEVQLTVELLNLLSLRACSGYFSGGIEPEEMVQALGKFAPDKLRTYTAINAKATVLEIKQAPFRGVTSEEATDAFRDLYGKMPPADKERLQTAFGKVLRKETMSDEDGCWAAKNYYGSLAKAPSALRATLVRIMSE